MNIVISQEEYELIKRGRDKAIEAAEKYQQVVEEYKKLTDELLESNRSLRDSLRRSIEVMEGMNRAQSELHSGLQRILASGNLVGSRQSN